MPCVIHFADFVASFKVKESFSFTNWIAKQLSRDTWMLETASSAALSRSSGYF